MKKYSIYNDQRRLKAEAHDEDMRSAYANEIEYSVKNSKTYRKTQFDSASSYMAELQFGKMPKVVMFKGTSDEAAYKYGGCLLNFASYKHPGGGFISGAMAQEEAICHASDLYEVIGDKKFAAEYEYNLGHMNNSLYEDWAIWSPDIIFDDNRGNVTSVNVITCPSPNLGAYVKNNGKTPDGYYKNVYGKRVKFILNVARDNKVSTLITGAFGCGVFRNDPISAAKEWLKVIQMYGSRLNTVVFAIPDDKNFKAFQSVISGNTGKPGSPENVLYGGIFLGKEAIETMRGMALNSIVKFAHPHEDDSWNLKGDHMTIYFHKSKNEECKKWVGANIGKKIWLKIRAVGVSDKAIAAMVECENVPCDNKMKHITLACNNTTGGKPSDSNSIETWHELDEELCVIGTVGVFDKRIGAVTAKQKK